MARAIRHPNVCRVFELGHADGHWFITMELATGTGLREQLRSGKEKPRPLGERFEDARAFCAGLAAIHAVGIIHRDVTPQNVLRMADGRLVLSDFGLAIEVTSNTTMVGGTPSYMPPETAMGGRADQRSDVWQAGAILHEMFFACRPDWEPKGDRVAARSGRFRPERRPSRKSWRASAATACRSTRPADRRPRSRSPGGSPPRRWRARARAPSVSALGLADRLVDAAFSFARTLWDAGVDRWLAARRRPPPAAIVQRVAGKGGIGPRRAMVRPLPARPRTRPPSNTTSPRRMVVRGQAETSRPA